MKSLWRLLTKSQTDKPNDRVKRPFNPDDKIKCCVRCGALFSLDPLYAAYEASHHEDDERRPPTSRNCERCLSHYDWSRERMPRP
jgi:hypothetical protein